MAQTSFGTSLADGAHQRLARMCGEWEGSYRLWFEPGEPVSADAQSGSLRAVLGGRYLVHEYQWIYEGKPRHGMAILGFHLAEGRWECAWIDDFHSGTSILFSQGDEGSDGALSPYSVLTSYGDGQTPPGPRWGWRTEIEQADDDHLRILMTNITPDGQEAPAVEVLYTRKR